MNSKMRKIFLNLLATFVAGCWTLGVHAQTDVTDTYLTNPSFELSAEEFAKPNTDRAVYQPEGWTSVYTGGDSNDMTFVDVSMTQDNVTWEAEEGKAYFIRQRWGDGGSTIGSTQTISGLSGGVYELTADIAMYGANVSAGNLASIYVVVDGKTITTNAVCSATDEASWNTYEVRFSVPDNGEATIGFSSYKANGNFKSAYDSFKLYYLGIDKSELETVVVEAEALYGDGSNEYAAKLKVSIDAAQAVVENNDATMTEVIDAIDALQAAIQQYKYDSVTPENPLDMTDWIVNPTADNGTSGWTAVGDAWRTMSSEHYSGVSNPYFDGNNWDKTGWNVTISQEIMNLPAGEYTVNCVSRASEKVTLTLAGKSGPFVVKNAIENLSGSIGGSIWEDAEDDSSEKEVNDGKGRGWGRQSITVAVVDGQPLVISFAATTDVKEQWFSVDEFELIYRAKPETAPVEPEGENVTEFIPGEAYVIKHMATGKFLSNGPRVSDYASDGGADAYKFYISSEEEGKYYIQQLSSEKYFAKSGSSGWDVTYYNANDYPNNQIWNLINNGETYKIKNLVYADVEKYLGTNSATADVPYYDKNNDCIDWKIILASEFIAIDEFIAKESLLNAIVSAQAFYDETAASGLYPEAAVSALSEAIVTIFAVYNKEEAVLEEITEAIEAINVAVKAYKLQVEAGNDNPADFTFLIQSPSFDNDSSEGWIVEAGHFAKGWGVAEIYNNTGNVYQEFEGLPNGKYGLVAQGFYRAGNVATAMAAHENETEVINAFLYMNDAKQAFISLYDEAKDLTTVNASEGYANGTQGASIVFNGGYYQIPEIEVFVSNGKITLGVSKEVKIDTDWTCFDNFKLIYYGYDLGKLVEELEALIVTAKVIDGKMQNIAAETLTDSIAYAESTLENVGASEEDLNIAIAKLKVAIEIANVSIAEYLALQAAIENAEEIKDEYTELVAAEAVPAYEDAILAAQDIYEDAEVEETADAILALDAATKAYLFTQENSLENPLDVTAYVIKNADATDGLNGWSYDNVVTNKGQHWSGNAERMYFEQPSASWGANSWQLSMDQDMTNLPAGKYELKVAMRASAEVVLTMTIGEEVVTAPTYDNTGGNIAIDGLEAEIIGSDDKEFANDGKGYGWEWRTINFELTETETVTIKVAASTSANKQWCSFTDFSLAYTTDDEEPDGISVNSESEVVVVNGSAILNPNNANLKVYAITGNLVLESNSNINLNALNKGVYLLNIEGQSSVVKFVVK